VSNQLTASTNNFGVRSAGALTAPSGAVLDAADGGLIDNGDYDV
jgi:hypothetical protein